MTMTAYAEIHYSENGAVLGWEYTPADDNRDDDEDWRDDHEEWAQNSD